ncbi:hypothetical protein DM860_001689 [Cuscuta australis]|uniref:Photolyase/cryptochrome alpha/beta domain-containing protein n=1 Tax=Cuscuta australis TaxID=267555 RepID=A0A328EDM9_9ASTE|nr:hypothetical protein DM860_001689 [Cuscuta australis]
MDDGRCRTIVWFRRDLRVEDNPALATAAREGRIFPVFIWCPKEEGQFYPGRVSRWWLKQSLIHLDQSLRSLGAELTLIRTDSTLNALLQIISAVHATKLVFNHLYDPISVVRDHEIKQKLRECGHCVQSYNAELLNEPWEVYKEDGKAYTKFDAYWLKCLHQTKEPVAHHLPPWKLEQAQGSIKKFSIEDLGLENETEKASNALLGRGWSPGWSNADKALADFVEHHLLNYSEKRHRVGANSTSLLSPHLHYGELSTRMVFHRVHMKRLVWAKEGNSKGEESAGLFLRAIGLREYSRYICFNFPFTHERSLLSNLKYFPWKPDQTRFKAWRQGQTGYPLVDAGMREMWATGWVHNKIRVIVASFSVKFLLLPWQWGMKYFWDTLLDADLESDVLGWQYISGSLPDGHELERLDCPEVQGFKFDPDGDYVRQWLPELARVPTEWIHHPWDAPPAVLKAAGLEIGLNYPKPIIDVELARERLSEAISTMQAAAPADNPIANDEVVFENSECNGHLVTPNATCPSNSSRDQKVPSIRNGIANKKRPKTEEEERQETDEFHRQKKNEKGEVSKMDEELCSTAESSSMKKQNTSSSSRHSFSVPEGTSSGTSVHYQESSM